MLQRFWTQYGLNDERFWRNALRNVDLVNQMDLSHRVVVPLLSTTEFGAKVVVLAELDIPLIDNRIIYTLGTSKLTEVEGRSFLNCIERED